MHALGTQVYQILGGLDHSGRVGSAGPLWRGEEKWAAAGCWDVSLCVDISSWEGDRGCRASCGRVLLQRVPVWAALVVGRRLIDDRRR